MADWLFLIFMPVVLVGCPVAAGIIVGRSQREFAELAEAWGKLTDAVFTEVRPAMVWLSDRLRRCTGGGDG